MVVEKEVIWLESFIKPVIEQELKQTIRNAFELLTKLEYAATLPISTPASDAVKGFISLASDKITKGELTIKSHHVNRGNASKFRLSASLPLTQVTRCQQLILNCIDIGGELLDSYESFGMTLASLDLIRLNAHAGLVFLECPLDSMTFPKMEVNRNSFSPELPEDLVIEFHTRKGSIVANSTVFSFSNAIPMILAIKPSKPHKTATYKGKHVELHEEISVELPCPYLQDAYNALKHCEALCIDLQNKISVHQYSN